MKHPHAEEIIKLVNNWQTHIVMVKEANNTKWKRQTGSTFHRGFDPAKHYRAIPKQHVECFLAFYNEGKKIEFLFGTANNVWKGTCAEPSWSAESNFRIKSDKPELVAYKQKLGTILANHHILLNVDGEELYSEKDICDAYFDSGVYRYESKK